MSTSQAGQLFSQERVMRLFNVVGQGGKGDAVQSHERVIDLDVEVVSVEFIANSLGRKMVGVE